MRKKVKILEFSCKHRTLAFVFINSEDIKFAYTKNSMHMYFSIKKNIRIYKNLPSEML